MNFTKTIMTTASAALISGAAFADGHMSMEMTIVSWGGAYSNSQLRAYHEPYSAKTGVTILNDDSSSTAVAQLRAMNEANNITWDVVDVEAAPAMQLCDEGLAMEIDPDTMLAAAPDGTPASEDFGDMLVSECFIPQIVYSTTFGYRTDLVGDTPPDNVCAVFDTKTYPGKRSLFSVPINQMEYWRPKTVKTAHLQNLIPLKMMLSGFLPVLTRLSYLLMAKSLWVLLTMDVCFL